jgi:chemotaxis signal transduction protein
MALSEAEQEVELLLFRLAGRGYASWRDQVQEVVDVGGGQPPVPGLPSSSLAALHAEDSRVSLVSMRLALGLPDAGPAGRILVVNGRQGRVGFLVDEVTGVVSVPTEQVKALPSRLGSRYVSATVQADGEAWSIVKWSAIKLPATARR